MSNFKDGELTEEELRELTAGVNNGRSDEMLDKLDKRELEELKNSISQERELSLEELFNVKAGMPQEMVEEVKEENANLFRKV